MIQFRVFYIYIFITLIISAPPKQQLFYNDGTETSSFNSQTGNVDIRNGDSDCPNGSSNTCLRLRGQDSEDNIDERIEIVVDSTVGFYDITLEFDAKGASGINNCYATYKVGYSVLVSFQTIWTTNGNAFDGTFVFNLNADNTDDDLRIRIGNNDRIGDQCHIDNIYVFGIPITPSPTDEPTINPSISPTKSPSTTPSVSPSLIPSITPTQSTEIPTNFPTKTPSLSPSLLPSQTPTKYPTTAPTNNPSTSPTKSPSTLPTIRTDVPSATPTEFPTVAPSTEPTLAPTKIPTVGPTNIPSDMPSPTPTLAPIKESDDESGFIVLVNNKPLFLLTLIGGTVLVLMCLCFILILLRQNKKIVDLKSLHQSQIKSISGAVSPNVTFNHINSTSNAFAFAETPGRGIDNDDQQFISEMLEAEYADTNAEGGGNITGGGGNTNVNGEDAIILSEMINDADIDAAFKQKQEIKLKNQNENQNKAFENNMNMDNKYHEFMMDDIINEINQEQNDVAIAKSLNNNNNNAPEQTKGDDVIISVNNAVTKGGNIVGSNMNNPENDFDVDDIIDSGHETLGIDLNENDIDFVNEQIHEQKVDNNNNNNNVVTKGGDNVNDDLINDDDAQYISEMLEGAEVADQMKQKQQNNANNLYNAQAQNFADELNMNKQVNEFMMDDILNEMDDEQNDAAFAKSFSNNVTKGGIL